MKDVFQETANLWDEIRTFTSFLFLPLQRNVFNMIWSYFSLPFYSTEILITYVVVQCHPCVNPQKSYHIWVGKKTKFYYATGWRLSGLILSHTVTNCAPNGGWWLYSPPIRRLWISLTPSSDIKIVNNPINTRHVKTKTNKIKSTVTYIQSINIHINLQLHPCNQVLYQHVIS
jgi:hypothetical protein